MFAPIYGEDELLVNPDELRREIEELRERNSRLSSAILRINSSLEVNTVQLEVITCRRADGQEVSLQEYPLAQTLSTNTTVRAEEIVLRVPDDRSVTTLVNVTPIRSKD